MSVQAQAPNGDPFSLHGQYPAVALTGSLKKTNVVYTIFSHIFHAGHLPGKTVPPSNHIQQLADQYHRVMEELKVRSRGSGFHTVEKSAGP